MALQFIAAGAMAYMSISQGNQQAEAIRREAEMNRMLAYHNAKNMELEAWEIERQGYTQSARYQSVIDSTVGSQIAGFASQNVDVTSGTARAIQQDTKTIGYLNALDIQTQARNKAYGLKVQAISTRLAGDFGVIQGGYEAGAARTAGYLNAITLGLSGYSAFNKAPAKAPAGG